MSPKLNSIRAGNPSSRPFSFELSSFSDEREWRVLERTGRTAVVGERERGERGERERREREIKNRLRALCLRPKEYPSEGVSTHCLSVARAFQSRTHTCCPKPGGVRQP